MTSYFEKPCERCGSKKLISRVWNEKSPNGSIVECAQIICSNKVCQAAFDKNLRKEARKQRELKRKKQARDLERKANMLRARKNK